jgi:hypothetical protein
MLELNCMMLYMLTWVHCMMLYMLTWVHCMMLYMLTWVHCSLRAIASASSSSAPCWHWCEHVAIFLLAEEDACA